ncbi:MAG: hypothetical protein GYB37_00650 [Algicola sp.]|nr:hypothetical protein [Algicola sp.]
MKKRILNFALILFMIPLALCRGQQPTQMDRGAWLEDLEFLEQSVAKTFPDFESNPRSELFLQEVLAIKENLDILTQKEIVYGIQKALGVLGDEGCNIMPFQEVLETNILPVSLYPFQDGWYICDAKDKSLVGQQVLGIDGMLIENVYDRMKPYLNADNEHYQKRLFAVYGLIPDLLRVAGLDGSDSEVLLQLSGNKEVLVKAGQLSEYSNLDRNLPNDGYFQLDQKNHKNENYWFEYMPGSESIYVQFQQISNNDKGSSFKKFIGLIEDEIVEGKAKKVILDLRYGGGGNGFKLKSFTDLLRDSEQINQDGNLIVLTSKATKGTLLELASILQLNTKSIIIGESTGEGPNTVGDVKLVQMPNSKIYVSLTNIFWPTSWDIDTRSALDPDINVQFAFEDYLKGEDPWLDAAMDYTGSQKLYAMDLDLMETLVGTYEVQGRKVSISIEEGDLVMHMSRRIKSFFEFKTKLSKETDGVLTTAIRGVKLHYRGKEYGDVEPLYLDWMGTKLNIERN